MAIKTITPELWKKTCREYDEAAKLRRLTIRREYAGGKGKPMVQIAKEWNVDLSRVSRIVHDID